MAGRAYGWARDSARSLVAMRALRMGPTPCSFVGRASMYVHVGAPRAPPARRGEVCAARRRPSAFSSRSGRRWCGSLRETQSRASVLNMKTDLLRPQLPSALYIHLPFCKKRCYYCDFAITAVGEHSVNQPLPAPVEQRYAEYVTQLLKEIQQSIAGLRSRMQAHELPKLKTLYLGGGTPSLLPIRYLEDIMALLRAELGFEPDIEITMEMDPGTFDVALARSFKQLGVTRASVGCQSFSDRLLSICGRAHNTDDIYRAIDALHSAQFDVYSLDLISGLPGQSLEDWHESLRCVERIAPVHVSTYDLELASSTKFGRLYKPGESPLPSDEDAALMYKESISFLNSIGILHYETSNFARPGFESRHNQVYWRNEAYYGFGMGSTSYVEGKRVTRPRTLRAYYDWVDQYALLNGTLDDSATDLAEQLEDTLMLGLRRVSGVDLAALEGTFGVPVQQVLCAASERFLVDGRAQLSGSVLSLRDPEGFLFQNDILSDLLLALERAALFKR
ncbi:Oxygen-independent coproporphyrinogen-III oxidase-like protein [Porphyridium purpureum]|uniref:Radical S-adenosyl methionine domain-containing protein 1, mitochondrial n=1 Tax=Porphyridium purpureum TaxID=35688 RepID=A0A5J4Z9J9_PORPP|nr:Oxygen-independent coproporphyrinogen-III oxidase-like protein [Porphyridium purpureum]|eukprot:POR6151..scf295_1